MTAEEGGGGEARRGEEGAEVVKEEGEADSKSHDADEVAGGMGIDRGGKWSRIAMLCKTLSEIRPGKELWKITARITRLWDAILRSSGEILSIDMILIDEKGTMVHGVINKAYIQKFKTLIQEDNVYVIANVRVTPAAKTYRSVENDKVVNFLPTTTIQKIKDTDDIPKYSFKFCNIDMLSKRINIDTYLSDVIGIAAYIGLVEETRTQFGVSKIRDIVLLIES
ncbi:uncharacterized protein LOC133918045 [Phragmites australis]|uniref:uncharacterized protein LOC133918045 n=1 Tax=Phragmites australis TaxID=29695 RepID=UPI002D768D84|nr:uncharacterized protein LOC133918045 [Phragmites australis]